MDKRGRSVLLIVISIVVNFYATLELLVTPVILQFQFVAMLLNLGFFGMSFAFAKTLISRKAIANVILVWSLLGWLLSLFTCIGAGMRLLAPGH